MDRLDGTACSLGLDVGPPPERIAAIIASESPKWKRLVERTNARLDGWGQE